MHLVKDGHAAEDASAGNKALIDALRHGGDLLNVFGDFPTLRRTHVMPQAYSPLWDAQLGLWTDKAVKQGLNKRQIDEDAVFNLAATRPDLLTGVDPATGARPLRGGRRRHQLCGHRLHRQAADRQPRRAGAQLAVPAQVAAEASHHQARGPGEPNPPGPRHDRGSRDAAKAPAGTCERWGCAPTTSAIGG